MRALVSLMIFVIVASSCSGAGGSDGEVADAAIIFDADFFQRCSDDPAAGCFGRPAALGSVIDFPRRGFTLTYLESGVGVESVDRDPLDTLLSFRAKFKVDNNSGSELSDDTIRDALYITFDTEPGGARDPEYAYSLPTAIPDGESVDFVASFDLLVNENTAPDSWLVGIRTLRFATFVTLFADSSPLEDYLAGSTTDVDSGVTEEADRAVNESNTPSTSAVSTSLPSSTATTTTATAPTKADTTTTTAVVSTQDPEPTTRGSQPGSDEQTIRTFVDELVELYQQEDVTAMVASLHPNHFEHWTVRQCETVTSDWLSRNDWGVDRITDIEYIGFTPLEVATGRVVESSETFLISYASPAGQREMRISLDPGGPFWFTACG